MLWVGIDTGVHTGMAVWDGERFLSIQTTLIHRAMQNILHIASEQGNDNVMVVVEDARQRKYIPRQRDERAERGRCQGAGSVKRDAIIWEAFLKDYGIPFAMIAPEKGLTKLSAEAFTLFYHYNGKTSEHGRDAAMMVRKYAIEHSIGHRTLK